MASSARSAGSRDDSVELEIAPGTVIRVARPAIAQPAVTSVPGGSDAIEAGSAPDTEPPPDETGH